MQRRDSQNDRELENALMLLKNTFGELGMTAHQLHFGNRLKPEAAWMKKMQS
jgi:hypothetical protein